MTSPQRTRIDDRPNHFGERFGQRLDHFRKFGNGDHQPPHGLAVAIAPLDQRYPRNLGDDLDFGNLIERDDRQAHWLIFGHRCPPTFFSNLAQPLPEVPLNNSFFHLGNKWHNLHIQFAAARLPADKATTVSNPPAPAVVVNLSTSPRSPRDSLPSGKSVPSATLAYVPGETAATDSSFTDSGFVAADISVSAPNIAGTAAAPGPVSTGNSAAADYPEIPNFLRRKA